MAFGQEIAKYVNATEKTQEGKNDKKGESEKGGTAQTVQATASTEEKNEGTLKPALWPLIRQVSIRARAAALSTGAILVDLPGKYPFERESGMVHDKWLKVLRIQTLREIKSQKTI